MGVDDSANFIFDSVYPVVTSAVANATTTPASLAFSVSDDTALQMMISLNSDFSGASWESYSSSSTISLATNPDTVYVKFKDNQDNTATTQTMVTPNTPQSPMIQDVSSITQDKWRLYLSWQIISLPTPGFDSYRIYRSATVNGTYSEIGSTSSGDRTVDYYSDTVTENDEYYYKVAAKDSDGNISIFSTSKNAIANGSQDGEEGGGGDDTTAPTISVGPTVASTTSSSATITWTTNENADSFIEYGTDINYGEVYGDSAVGTSHSVALPATLSGSITYHYRVRTRDTAGNLTTSSDGTFATEAGGDTTAPVISSVVTGTPNPTSVTITWTTNEEAGSLVDFGTVANTYTQTQGNSEDTATSHSVTLISLSPSTAYYYQIKSQDTAGNQAEDDNSGSSFTFTTDATPDPGDITAPVISSVATSSLDANGITITWTTDEASDSVAGFSLDENYVQEKGSTTLTTSHSVSLLGLAPSTAYYFQVKSRDAAGNLQTETDATVYTFTTSAGADATSPVISSGPTTSSLSSTGVTIAWTTDESSNSYVDFGTVSESYTETKGSGSDATTSHTVSLTNLTAETKYYYQVRSLDSASNQVASEESSFTTDVAPVTPSSTITAVDSGTPDSDSTTITFTTAENVYGYIDYGTTDSYGKIQGNNITLATAHSIQITGLTAETTYHFRVRVKSFAGDYTLGTDQTFTTDEEAEAPSAEGPTISGVVVDADSLNYNSATIEWVTDENADSAVIYGKTTEYGSSYGDLEASTTSHSISLPDLDLETPYYFKVRSENSAGNKTTDDNSSIGYTFSTLSGSQDTNNDGEADQISDVAFEISSMITNSTYTEEEIMNAISNIEAIVISSSGPDDSLEDNTDVTINWETNKDSKGKVVYKQEEQDTWTNKEEDITTDSGYTQDHEVLIKNLEPQTTYEYYVVSTSILGNQVTSGTETFTTGETPKISNIQVNSTSLNEATISWTTNSIKTSILEYGTSTKYGSEEEEASSTSETDQTVLLTGLTSGEEYHFRIKGIDDDEETTISNDQTFITSALPIITNVDTQDIQTEQITISWKTNEKTDSLVEYSFFGEEEGTSQGVLEAATDHTIILENLIPGVKYQATVQSKDQFGNQAESEQFTFQTEEDNNPPQIQNITSDTTMYPGEDLKIQTVISWVTSKDSYSTIAYRKGAGQSGGGIDEKLQEIAKQEVGDISKTTYNEWSLIKKPTLTKNHLFILMDFDPSSVYQYKVISIDKRGNSSISKDYSFLTPSKQESIFDLIISNFEETFGWMKNVR